MGGVPARRRKNMPKESRPKKRKQGRQVRAGKIAGTEETAERKGEKRTGSCIPYNVQIANWAQKLAAKKPGLKDTSSKNWENQYQVTKGHTGEG